MTSRSRVSLWLVDRGENFEADTRNMMEISPEFARSTALTFKAHLAHVKAPKTGWSAEATRVIRNAFGLLNQIGSAHIDNIAQSKVFMTKFADSNRKM